MKVTARQLRAKRACPNQVLIFKKEWQEGVEITEEVLQRAVELKLDLSWFALEFLPKPAQEDYDRATDSAWGDLDNAIASAWGDLDKATVSALHQIIAEYGL